MKTKLQIVLGSVLLSAFSSAYAQQTQIETTDGKQTSVVQPQAPLSDTDDSWKVSITPYLWIPGPNATIHLPFEAAGRHFDGNASLNAGWWDVLSKLSANFLVLSADGRVEVSKGKWGGFVDGYWLYAKITENNDGSKFLLHDSVDVTDSLHITNKFQAGQVNFGPRYLIGSIPFDKSGDFGVAFEAYGGGRANWVSNSIDGSVNLNHVGVGYNGSASQSYIRENEGRKIYRAADHLIAPARLGGDFLERAD